MDRNVQNWIEHECSKDAKQFFVNDFQVHQSVQVQEMDAMPDPCPMPGAQKRRGLNEKERLLYAPMSDVGGLLYDRDAVYIDIPDWKVPCYVRIVV